VEYPFRRASEAVPLEEAMAASGSSSQGGARDDPADQPPQKRQRTGTEPGEYNTYNIGLIIQYE
jgi:hypothetical protein